MRILNIVALIAGILFNTLAFAQEEALCAEVKIEILQELTIERQGFEAVMKITNGLDSYTIDDIAVTVNFADDEGNAVTE
ncbi:hypothetical protein [Marinagarivorans algicola]|uniref:hypothetical protein n=1 Tax=Marinagarivorans algicola TaxID=1513270 RepID=UPI0006B93188|nr:hypothetical protein [Marinagarivorans algicola]